MYALFISAPTAQGFVCASKCGVSPEHTEGAVVCASITGIKIACARLRELCGLSRQIPARTTVGGVNTNRRQEHGTEAVRRRRTIMAQHATTLPEQQQARAASHPRNVGDLERGLSLIGGTALVLCGLRRSLGNLALMLGGGALIYRGLTGYCPTYQALGVNTAHRDTGHGVALHATITVNKPISEVYQFWRHLENHPRFMQHLESVVSTNGKRSH